MKNLLNIKTAAMTVAAPFLIMSACAVQNMDAGSDIVSNTSEQNTDTAFVAIEDFARLSGGEWTGELSYLDYSSGTPQSIPVKMQFAPASGTDIDYKLIYPKESQYNAEEVLSVSPGGDRVNDKILTSRILNPDGRLMLVTEHDAEDNGRAAKVRLTHMISDDLFVLSKDVRFDTDGSFVRRNAYTLRRLP